MAARAYTRPDKYDNAAFLCTLEWIQSSSNSFPFDEQGLKEVHLPRPPMVAEVRFGRRDRLEAIWKILRTGRLEIAEES